MQCNACGFQFGGIAVQCPRCETPLASPPAVSSPGGSARTRIRANLADGPAFPTSPPGQVTPRPLRLGHGQKAVVVIVIAVVVALGLAASLLYSFVIGFCLFGSASECEDREAKANLFFFGLGVPASLAAAGLAGYGTVRLFRGRNRRRDGRPQGPSMSKDVPTHRRG